MRKDFNEGSSAKIPFNYKSFNSCENSKKLLNIFKGGNNLIMNVRQWRQQKHDTNNITLLSTLAWHFAHTRVLCLKRDGKDFI